MDLIELIVHAGARAATRLLVVVIVTTFVLLLLLAQLNTALSTYTLRADVPSYTEHSIVDRIPALCLRVIHPTKLLLGSTKSASKITVQLLQSTCDKLAQKSPLPLTVTATHNLSTTNSSNFTLASSISLTIASNSHIIISDDKGASLPSTFTYTSLPPDSLSVYMQQSSPAPIFGPASRSALSIGYASASSYILVNLPIETTWNVFWRQFLTIVATEGATIILAVVPILIGMHIIQRGLDEYHWKKQIDKIHHLYKKMIEQSGSGSEEFIAQFVCFYEKYKNTQDIEEVKNYYDQTLKEMGPQELTVFLKILGMCSHATSKPIYDILFLPIEVKQIEENEFPLKFGPDKIHSLYNEIGTEKINGAFEWVILESSFSSSIKEEILKVAKKLHPLIDNKNLENKLNQQYYMAFLRVWKLALYKSDEWPAPTLRNRLYQAKNTTLSNTYKAESDSCLFWYNHRPQWLIRVINEPEPCLVLGESGFGKSAAVLQLIHHITTNHFLVPGNSKENVLPIYWRYAGTNMRLQEPLYAFATVLAHTLVGYLSVNPEGYLYTSLLQQTAIAYLFAFCFDLEKEFELVCGPSQLTSNANLAKMIAKIHGLSAQFDYRSLALHKLTDKELAQLLSNAFPAYVSQDRKTVAQLHNRWILIDVQQSGISEREVGQLLQTISTLAGIGYTIKAFLPNNALTKEWRGSAINISWRTEELNQMFVTYLSAHGDSWEEIVRAICDPDSIDELEARLFSSAALSPRIIRGIGHHFNNEYYKKNARLTTQDIARIFSELGLL